MTAAHQRLVDRTNRRGRRRHLTSFRLLSEQTNSRDGVASITWHEISVRRRCARERGKCDPRTSGTMQRAPDTPTPCGPGPRSVCGPATRSLRPGWSARSDHEVGAQFRAVPGEVPILVVLPLLEESSAGLAVTLHRPAKPLGPVRQFQPGEQADPVRDRPPAGGNPLEDQDRGWRDGHQPSWNRYAGG